MQSNSVRVKKDALWKPILRGFRIFIRTSLKEYLDVNKIFDGSGDLSRHAQESCKRYIKSIGAPEHIQNNKLNYYALTIAMVHSSSAGLKKFFICIPKLQNQLSRLTPLFSKIFRENSIKLRKEFFANELVRYLWTRYL